MNHWCGGGGGVYAQECVFVFFLFLMRRHPPMSPSFPTPACFRVRGGGGGLSVRLREETLDWLDLSGCSLLGES